MRKVLTIIGIMAVSVATMGQSCTGTNSANREQAAQTRELQRQSNDAVGMPGITNFTEKRHMADLYELRDQQNLATYTYAVDLNGNLHHVCDSTGYGIPFSAQFSNPTVFERFVVGGERFGVPQPEPNGLWPPTSSSATWVICASPDGEFKPMYVEPSIIVSQFPLAHVGSWAVAE